MVIFMEPDKAKELTPERIKDIVKDTAIPLKFAKLERYYRGDHAILNERRRDKTAPDNRLVNNMARYITDTAVGYFLGQPVIYSSENRSFYGAIQDIFEYNDEQDHNTELAKMASITGSAVEMMYTDEDARIRFTLVNPAKCILVYSTDGQTLLAAIRTINTTDWTKRVVKKVEWWDAQQCRYYRLEDDGSIVLVDTQEHYWQDVPFTEYINNSERIGDFEGVVGIIDAYNRVQSNTANFFQYNDEAMLKILKMGEVSTRDIREMKEKGAIVLEDGGDIQWLIKEVNDGALENYKNRLREDMHLFSSIPNMTSDSFGTQLSGVAVSYKLWGLEQTCAVKERKFKRCLQRRIELITNMLNLQGGAYDYRDIDMQFRRNKPQNLLEVAQIMTQLGGEVSHETRLKLLPTIDSVKDELERIERERQQEAANFGNRGGYDGLAKALQDAGQEVSHEPAEP